MARKRMISPDIWTDEKFAFLDEGAQLLFLALISQADDEGRLEWSAGQIKLRCFPASPVTLDVFETRKTVLVESGLAYEFASNGRVYLILLGWFKNQKLERTAFSKIPDPPNLRTESALSEYLYGLQKVRKLQKSSETFSEPQTSSEIVRESPPEEKRREEKRKSPTGDGDPPSQSSLGLERERNTSAYRLLDNAYAVVAEHKDLAMSRQKWRSANKAAALDLLDVGKTGEQVVDMLSVAYLHPSAELYRGITMLAKLAEHWPRLTEIAAGKTIRLDDRRPNSVDLTAGFRRV